MDFGRLNLGNQSCNLRCWVLDSYCLFWNVGSRGWSYVEICAVVGWFRPDDIKILNFRLKLYMCDFDFFPCVFIGYLILYCLKNIKSADDTLAHVCHFGCKIMIKYWKILLMTSWNCSKYPYFRSKTNFLAILHNCIELACLMSHWP